ncbi:PhzF family phenazine biosynthesis protein [Abyssogena phaseoliformis symbiont]|uniref:PhzF family phenazine biosynthesis protein n=1 Tax=Abyssogena phaseoliformis symbiont TaxID=596095 RepID=UPI00315AA77D
MNCKTIPILIKSIGFKKGCNYSKGGDFDFVIRCFVPKYGIDEDPVTGSSFTQLVPYWSKNLIKTT